MGKYEDQLSAIGAGTDWSIEKIQTLSLALSTLQRTMANLAASPGWKGASADDASEVFQQLKKNFTVVQDAVTDIETTVTRANAARSNAASSTSDLPSAKLDPFWRTAVTAGTVVVHPVLGPLASDTALSVIEGFLGNQREDAAKKKVESLSSTLEEHRADLQKSQADLQGVAPVLIGGDVPIPKDDGPTGPTMPGGYPGGGYPGGGYPGGGGPAVPTSGANPGGSVGPVLHTDLSGPTGPNGTTGPTDGPHWVDTTPHGPSAPSVDDGGPGYTPGHTPGGGAGGAGGQGGSAGNGVGGASPLGAGVIGGGAGAALLAGSKLAGGGTAGLGGLGGFGGGGVGAGGAGVGGFGGASGAGGASAARGTGGLLGQAGGPGASGGGTGSGAANGASSGAAGGRPGMMAGGGQQGGATEEKAKGQGLGGPIAPTLDDDDESGPRSKGAAAGGRG